jgi:thioredoxin 1
MSIEVLKFYAEWCAPCKILSQRLENKKLTGINIEEDHLTAIKYGVRKIPALVFLKDGEEVSRSAGLITEEQFDEILKELNTDISEINVEAEVITQSKKEE